LGAVQEGADQEGEAPLRRDDGRGEALRVGVVVRGPDVQVRGADDGGALPPPQGADRLLGIAGLSEGELEKELRSWDRFADALRAGDRSAFAQMLRSSCEYAPAMRARLEPFPVEALFMGLVLSQHRTIEQLKREISELRKAIETERLDL